MSGAHACADNPPLRTKRLLTASRRRKENSKTKPTDSHKHSCTRVDRVNVCRAGIRRARRRRKEEDSTTERRAREWWWWGRGAGVSSSATYHSHVLVVPPSSLSAVSLSLPSVVLFFFRPSLFHASKNTQHKLPYIFNNY